MKTLEEFRNQIVLLNKEFGERLNDKENNRYVITDGALNPEVYHTLLTKESNTRVMWLMKEPYDEINGTGGGWDFYEGFFKGKPSYYERLIKTRTRATWQPVVYVSYSILNGYVVYNDMGYIRNNPKMADVLNSIAWVNVHKLPAIGMTRSSNERLIAAYDNTRDLIIKQFEILRPQIVICGGTFNIVRSNFKEKKSIKFSSVKYLIENGTLYIDAYHPAQTRISRERYCNDIVLLSKYFIEEIYPTIN